MVPMGINVNFGNMYKLDQWVIQNGKMDDSIFFLIACWPEPDIYIFM